MTRPYLSHAWAEPWWLWSTGALNRGTCWSCYLLTVDSSEVNHKTLSDRRSTEIKRKYVTVNLNELIARKDSVPADQCRTTLMYERCHWQPWVGEGLGGNSVGSYSNKKKRKGNKSSLNATEINWSVLDRNSPRFHSTRCFSPLASLTTVRELLHTAKFPHFLLLFPPPYHFPSP